MGVIRIIIGITGRSGSGKSTVAGMFKSAGFMLIDADEIAHKATDEGECLERLISEFGKEIVDESGRLIRRRLADIVFCNKEKLKKLNEITHFYILKIINDKLNEYINSNADVIMDVPLLFESGLDKKCDVTIGVIAKENTAAERIMRRDNIDFESAKRRIKAQHGNEYFIKRAEYILDTSCTLEELEEKTSSLIRKLQSNDSGEKL